MKVLILAVVLVCALLAASAIRRQRAKRKTVPHGDSVPDMDDVHAALAEGQKIRAIKIYRQITGTDLRIAKDDVGRIARGESPTTRLRLDPATRMEEVHAALAKGEKIRAIKIYRQATGTDLRTAKDDVDRIARGDLS